MRRVILSLLALVVLAMTAVTAFFLLLRTARPRVNGSIEVMGVSAPVEIARDSLGVAHVSAGSEHDLLFAQGWVHAQERLWQMELFRRVAEGRLAEIFGAGFVPTDRFLRTIGMARAAREQESRLPPATRAALEAYAAGVNAYLAQRRGLLPPEFVVLRFQPERWTVVHTLAIERIMAWDLSAYGIAVGTTRSARALGRERAARLVPAYPEWGPTIVDFPDLPDVPSAAAALLDAASMTRASNAWVIGGARTRSGRPILANDMHLALRAPSLWYLMALHAGSLSVAGMTLPGAPWVVAGHNLAIAWGYTNSSLDDLDFFVEHIDPQDSTRYLTPSGSEPFLLIHDSIRVRGGEAVPLTIRRTRHGPIIDDIADAEQRGPVAMRWAGLDPSRTSEAIAALNRAGSWDEFLAAVSRFDNPHQNVVYADTAGNFGYVMGGRIPVRGQGRAPPVLPVPGWTGEWDWTGWVPFEEHPRVLNPPSGFVVTANNRQAAGERADRISTYWEQPYRAARIRQLILDAGTVDADAVHRMQLDVHDALAERYRTMAAEAAAAAGLDETARVLAGWDLRAGRDSRGAALFYAWYEMMHRNVRRALYDGADGGLTRAAMDEILDAGALPWGDTTTHAFQSIALAAVRSADSLAAGRTWGQLHRVHAAHALAASRLLERVLHLNVGRVASDGSPTTVNVSDFTVRQFPVDASYGPSQRHVVDMGDVDGAGGFILPTGQSGLPFERHYRDQWQRWREGGLWRIPLDREAALARSPKRLTLQPAARPE